MNSPFQPCSPSPLLEFKRVTVGYDRWPVLSDLSFKVADHEVIGVTGDNAAGKTSIFRGLFADGAWLRGYVGWCGQAVSSLRGGIVDGSAAWVRQDRPIFPTLTVHEALRAAAMGRTARDRRTKIERLLSRIVDLRPLLDREMNVLSGGERALTSLGIGLLNEPRLICLDEPAANLSEVAQERLRSVIAGYVVESPAACVVVEHQRALLASIATRIIEVQRPKKEPLERDRGRK